jgi:hypothetical protein
MRRFITFEVYRSSQGPVLYALSTDGQLWEKYPGRPWGTV